MTRGARVLRDGTAVVWILAAMVISIVHRWVPAASWLLVHLVLLGALTHSALVWSEHFAHTLLRSRPRPGDDGRQAARILLLAGGSLSVFVGVGAQQWWLVVVGAALVTGAVTWHFLHLLLALRRALPNRFRTVTRYYLAAAVCLPVGAGFGAALALGLDDQWHGRLLVAHLSVNLLGWIGLTVVGTLVTFWPTMLRTRMDARAERLAGQALPVIGAGLLVMVAGSLSGVQPLAAGGLVVYSAGLVWSGRALWRPAREKPPREFAPAAVGLAALWAAGFLIWVGVVFALSPSWEAVAATLPGGVGLATVGFAAQLLTGALSYLVPTMMGRSPAGVRAAQDWMNRGTTWRLTVINGGLLLWLVPAPSWVRVFLAIAVLVGLAMFLPLLAGAVSAALRSRTDPEGEAGSTRPDPTRERRPQAPSVWSGWQLVAGVLALALALTLGVGLDPAAAGLPAFGGRSSQTGVEPTGNTTRVEVATKTMSFVPARITVPRGDRLVVTLTNTDSTTSHDLVIDDVRTPRLRPGERAELDAGIIGSSTQGWCSVAGHRQMGMVIDIVVEGGAAGSDPGPHPTRHAPAPADAELSGSVDPVLPRVTSDRVRKPSLRVQEVPLEVAPGVWQRRWTFNGRVPGPTLHGRVGDVFEITLFNDGSVGHSIDFHAGSLAPDRPMRTIPPGESLTYRFTATRAGIWMYHCSTHPMSVHIGAGMHGAVIIEPEGLPAVDRSYVLVQSEVFLGVAAATAASATEVDAEKVFRELPDRVVFNGIANQYDQFPFAARVGERVRFWLLDAGPNRASSFHIVGGQFDTVWSEGRYLLRQGRGPIGETGGGSQALALQPAQGGFVELTFPEPGHYPAVSHIMVDAERGAHGIVRVT